MKPALNAYAKTATCRTDTIPDMTREPLNPLLRCWRFGFIGIVIATMLLIAISGAYARPADQKKSDASLVIDLPAPEGEVIEAVRTISGDGIIHGSQIYAREPILDGAAAADSSDYYGKWQGEGQVFYKIRTEAIAPRHFKDSADIGTITVRYVVEGLSAMNTRLQIDAVYIEKGGHRVDLSDGSVETSEFKEIQDRIRAIEYQKKKDAQGLQARQAFDASHAPPEKQRAAEIARLESADAGLQNLRQRLRDLQHDLEVRAKNSSVELKSAPFHSATKLRSVAPNEDLLILIVTPYWYGIETTAGQHGWVARDQVEPLP
jgi:hypothetical protein